MTALTGILQPFDSPFFSPIIIPALPSLNLTEAEQASITRLQQRQWRDRFQMQLADSYYRGMQVITNLGISIPDELSGLRTLVSWGRVPVDPMVERLSVDGFRLPGATDSDDYMADIWLNNRMDAEQSLAFIDALAKRAGFFTIGSPETPGDAPVICVESPLNISVAWDVRGVHPKEAWQTYWMDNRRHAVLYVLGETIYISENDKAEWEITGRDKHGFQFLPVIRMANEPRSDARDGSSEITPEIMSIIDGACRTLLGLEVAREFYSVPQKYALGVVESDFQSADGTPKTAWEAYISSVLMLERDDQGQLPTVGQFQAYDPSVFTKIIEMYGSQMAGATGAPPQELGLYTQGNPISAEAANVSEGRRDRRARMKQRGFGGSLIEMMQMAIRFDNGGALPDKFRRMEIDWMDPSMPNVAGTADAITKYIAEGAIPATSDVTLKRAGFSTVERARLAADRDSDLAYQMKLAEARAVPAAPPAGPVDPAAPVDVAPAVAPPSNYIG